MIKPTMASTTATATTDGRTGLQDASLVAFVEAHYGRLLGLARLICRDGSEAADAVQLGLEQAWRRRETLSEPERVRPWLDRIVVREAVRIDRRRRTWLGRLVTGPSVGWVEPTEGTTDSSAAMIALRDAFARLPAEQRAVVALHHHLGYTVAETATIVDAPLETVRTRLRRATERLRRELEEADDA
jgi:RNA polymerase sigma-70 factor (ECF subfamily)